MIWLALSLGIWGLVHSWLASLGTKDAIRRRVSPMVWSWYRLAYNAFSVVSLLPTALIIRLIPDHVVYVVPSPWRYFMLAAQGLSGIGLLVAVSQTDAMALLGLKQLMGREESSQLVTKGFYQYMRHPMYFFGLLFIWLSYSMTANSLVACIALTLYLLVGAYFEERKLTRIFGAAYSHYKARTPMIVPLPTILRGRGRQTAHT